MGGGLKEIKEMGKGDEEFQSRSSVTEEWRVGLRRTGARDSGEGSVSHPG